MEEFNQYFDICTRPAYPELRPLKDIFTDQDMREDIVRIADEFFHFNHTYPVYSGFARRADSEDKDPMFYAQVWVGEKLRRTVAFRATGYVGVLHIDIDNDLGFRQGLGRDLIGASYWNSGQSPERVMATVSLRKMEVSYEIRR